MDGFMIKTVEKTVIKEWQKGQKTCNNLKYVFIEGDENCSAHHSGGASIQILNAG